MTSEFQQANSALYAAARAARAAGHPSADAWKRLALASDDLVDGAAPLMKPAEAAA